MKNGNKGYKEKLFHMMNKILDAKITHLKNLFLDLNTLITPNLLNMIKSKPKNKKKREEENKKNKKKKKENKKVKNLIK